MKAKNPPAAPQAPPAAVAALAARRAAVVARHETLESVTGSGWHPDDEPRRAARGPDTVPLSKRPVAIQADGVTYFVGPDVAAVRAKLGEYAAREAGDDPRPELVNAMEAAARHAGGAGDVIELRGREQNGVLLALAETGVLCVGTGLQ